MINSNELLGISTGTDQDKVIATQLLNIWNQYYRQ